MSYISQQKNLIALGALVAETSELITQAIACNGSDAHVEIARLYRILGIAQTALGRPEAKNSLVRAIAILIHIYGTDQHHEVAELYSLLKVPVQAVEVAEVAEVGLPFALGMLLVALLHLVAIYVAWSLH